MCSIINNILCTLCHVLTNHFCFVDDPGISTMDDLFGMLYSDLEPSKKLLTAVTNNMLDSVDRLATEGFDLNTVLHHHNGNTALHIACMNGHHGCVKILLKHNANADCKNNFDFTPLMISLRHGFADCVRLLLAEGTPLMNPYLVWEAQTMNETYKWLDYNVPCLKTLINATPNVSVLSDVQFRELCLIAGGEEVVKYYILCGGVLSEAKRQHINDHLNIAQWLRNYCSSKRLLHHAFESVRRAVRPNVFYAVPHLRLPYLLEQEFIITDAIMNSY